MMKTGARYSNFVKKRFKTQSPAPTTHRLSHPYKQSTKLIYKLHLPVCYLPLPIIFSLGNKVWGYFPHLVKGGRLMWLRNFAQK